MAYLPWRDIEIPEIDLVSLAFDSPYSWANDATILHIDAADETNYINKSQARTIIKRLAHVLRHRFSVGKAALYEDVVTCFASNQILLPTVFFGIIAAGGVYSAASSSLTPFELSRQLKTSKSNLIIASEDTLEVALKSAKECGIPVDRVLVLDSASHQRSLRDTVQLQRNYLETASELNWARPTDLDTLEKKPICLMFSSGTTGPPKGVMLSHKNIVAQSLTWQATLRDSLNTAKLAKPGKDPKNFKYGIVAHLPAAHVAGSQGYFMNGTMAGGATFWMTKFVLADFLHYTKKYRPTHMLSVPSIYLQIINSPDVTDHFHSLVHAQVGAAPMGPGLQKLGQEKIGCYLNQSYGLTETSASLTMTPWYQNDTTGGVGALLPNSRLRIVNDDLEDVVEGQEGEFLIKGPIVTRGYYNNPEATAATFTPDGWLRTGDIGLRRDGLFYIVDRKKELIKYKGLQIAPAELEAYLLSHESILDAAVIGVEDPKVERNEVPRAYIVRKGDKKSRLTTEQEVKDYVKKNLAAHKQLRGGVVFVDDIPKSSSGKILRRELRDHATKEKLQVRLSKL
ncbi:hypothetical protein VE04_03260 [Pseudogymnoascus sp. 24MN13]|nr:hypothetical protein VE04_03260 [Pseudogymnoascus sp. 24MN13]